MMKNIDRILLLYDYNQKYLQFKKFKHCYHQLQFSL